MGFVERCLTKRVIRKKKGKRDEVIVVKPNGILVWGVKFAIAMTLSLSALEVFYMVLFRAFSSEIFAGITSLTGFVTGILVSHKS